ncbi:MAG: porin [Pirellulales bacterium]|nr:porin [Pirellulales bacterium]
MRKLIFACIAGATVAGGPSASGAPAGAVRPSAFQYDSYYRQGDENFTSLGAQAQPAEQAPETASVLCGDDVSCSDPCDVACGDGCRGGYLGALEDLSLASLVGIGKCSPWQIGGWTEGVYMDNNVPLSQTYNDLASFDDVPDHFHVGQQWLYLGRTIDGSAGWDLGGRVDLVYGTDAQKTQAFGNPRSFPGLTGAPNTGTWDASLDHGEYGWAIPQAYLEVGSGDLAVKVGHFFTPIGYEVIPVTGNFFRSHSYTMFNSEPFTHTGALATYSGYENLTLYGGWALGWDTGFDQLNGGNIAIGGFAYNISDAVTFTYMNTYGNFGWRDGGDDNSYSHSAVLTAALTDNLQYIAQTDMVDTSNPGVSEYDTVGLNQYLIYKISDLVSAGGRAEWWKADGVSYNEVTGGFNIHALDNLVFRPEIRKDWAPGAGIDEDTALVDVILTY